MPQLLKIEEKVVPHLVKEVTKVKEVATKASSLPSLLLHTQVSLALRIGRDNSN